MTGRVYKIYLGLPKGTENAENSIVQVLKQHKIPGATIYPATGLWHHETEESRIIEIAEVAGNIDIERIKSIVNELRVVFSQGVVIFTISNIEKVNFVTQVKYNK